MPSSSPSRMSITRHVGLVRLDERAALGGRAGRAHDVATLAAQEELEPLAQRLVVFDQDESEAHDPSSIGARDAILSEPSLRKHRTNTVTESARGPRRGRGGGLTCPAVAKDTEKLIRQLSLIAYLMAERRPVTATEIRRDVEGYSDMTEDAFARRFYADRAELDSLGIHLTVDKPADGFSEQENYSLAPEAFFLPAVAFSDGELAALQTALSLLDGEFAYAEPLRLALQQLTWGRPEPARLARPARDRARHHGLGRRRRAVRAPGQARHGDLPPQADRVRVLHDADAARRRARVVDPYELLFEGGQFYLVGFSHERGARARLPALAHPREGGLRDEGRARLPAPRRLRPARLREPHPVAARRAAGDGGDLGVGPDRLARGAQLRRLRDARRTPTTAGASSARPTPSPAWCSPGRSATSRTRACSARPSWRTSCTAGSTGWPSCTGASRASPSPPAARRRTRTASASPARARARPARSGPSASPGWSRSPPCSSRRGGRARSCASRTSAGSCRSPPRSCARTCPC